MPREKFEKPTSKSREAIEKFNAKGKTKAEIFNKNKVGKDKGIPKKKNEEKKETKTELVHIVATSPEDFRAKENEYRIDPEKEGNFANRQKVEFIGSEKQKEEYETEELSRKREFYSSENVSDAMLNEFEKYYQNKKDSALNEDDKEEAEKNLFFIERERKERENSKKLEGGVNKLVEGIERYEKNKSEEEQKRNFYAYKGMTDKVLDDLENFYQRKTVNEKEIVEKEKAEVELTFIKEEKYKRINNKKTKGAALGGLVEDLRQNIETGGQEARKSKEEKIKIYQKVPTGHLMNSIYKYYQDMEKFAVTEAEKEEAREHIAIIEEEVKKRGQAIYEKTLDNLVKDTLARGESRTEKGEMYASEGVSDSMLEYFEKYYTKKTTEQLEEKEKQDAEDNLFAIKEEKKRRKEKRAEIESINKEYDPKIEASTLELEALLREDEENEKLIRELRGEPETEKPATDMESREVKEQVYLDRMNALNEQLEIAKEAGDIAEVARLKSDLLKAEREYGEFTKEETPAKGEEETPVESPETDTEQDINDFIESLNIQGLISPEFNDLNQAQKLLVLQTLKNRIIDIVKSDAKTQYSRELREKMAKGTSKNILSRMGRWTKNTWVGMKEGTKKDITLKNIESDIFKEMSATEEGKKNIADNLNRLVNINKDRNINIGAEGKPVISFINLEDATSAGEKLAIERYNEAANDFRQIPDEWGLESKKVLSGEQKRFASKHRKEYEKAKASYENAKAELLNLRINIKKENPGKVFTEMTQMDFLLKQDQLLNTHPEVEEIFDHLGDKAGTEEYKQKRIAFVKNFVGGPKVANQVAFGVGFGLRAGSKVLTGLAAKYGIISATAATWTVGVAAPVLGGAIGSWRGILRGRTLIREKEMAARHGAKDKEKSRVATVDATHLDRQLNELIQKIKNETYFDDEKEKDKDKAREKYIALLSARIAHTQGKMGKGEVNYGDANNSLNNTSNLMDTLSEALVLKQMLDKDTETEVNERVNHMLKLAGQGIHDRTTTEKRKFLAKQILKGAKWGATMGLAGYGVKTALDATGGTEWISDKIHDAKEAVGYYNVKEFLGIDHSTTILDTNGAIRTMTPDGKTIIFPKNIHDKIVIIDHDGKISTEDPIITKNPITGAMEVKSSTGATETISPNQDSIVIKTPGGDQALIRKSINSNGDSVQKVIQPNGEMIETTKTPDGEVKNSVTSPDGKEVVTTNPDGTKEVIHREIKGDKQIETTTDEKGKVIHQEEKPYTKPKTEPAEQNDTTNTGKQIQKTETGNNQTQETESGEQADTTPETKTSAGDRLITDEFSIKLGENGAPKNLENAFSEISANRLELNGNTIDEEFATKSLNMGANLVALSEGKGVIGIDPEDFKNAVSVHDGMIEVKDHDAFNKILAKLQEHADQAWNDGTLQSKGGAMSFIGNKSSGTWLKIAHGEGMHQAPDGTSTGIEGHPEATDVKDFSQSDMVLKAKISAEDLNSGTNIPSEELVDANGVNISKLRPTTPELADVDEPEETITKLNPKTFAGFPADKMPNEIYQDVAVSPKELAQVMKLEEHNIHKLFKGSKGREIWEKIKVEKTPAKEILTMKENGEKLLAYRPTEILGKGKVGMMSPEQTDAEIGLDYKPIDPDYKPLAGHLSRLQKISGLHPIEKNLLQSDETVEKFMIRAMKKILKMGRIDEVKL